MGKDVTGVVLGVVTALIGLVAIVHGWELGCAVTAEGLGIGLFPLIVGIFLVIAGIYQAFSVKLRRESIDMLSRRQASRVAAVYGSLVVYAAVVQPLGYLPATVIFLFVQSWLLGARDWLKIGGVALGAALSFFWVFQIWMQMPLPRGILELLGVL